jgi:CDP-diacylglycerol--serine O-phosphatidyltransferase
MSALGGVGWAIVLFFAVCCALRLARFNTQANADPPSYAAPFFTGVPAPAGAGLVIVPLFLSFEWGDWLFRSPYLNAMTVSGVALLMVSRVPTVSLKRIRIPHDLVVPTLLAVGVLTAFFTTAPWPTLTLIGIVYVGSIPVTVFAYYRLRRAAGTARTGGPAAPALVSPDATAGTVAESSAQADELRR